MKAFPRITQRIPYKWLIVVSVTLGMFMSLLDHTIVNVAIPQLQRDFNADLRHVQWVVTIYMITQAVVIPIAPFLIKLLGEKRSYVWTLTAFLLGSLLCGFAWNLPSLIVFRLIQGIGGGVLLPLVTILLYSAFSVEERGMAVSVMNIPLLIAPLLGPVLGGYLLTTVGWPWAFFINVPLGIVAVAIAQIVLRPTPAQSAPRFDGVGFAAIAAGSATMLYAVSALSSGAATKVNMLLLLVGVGAMVAFVYIQRRNTRLGRASLIDLGRFADRTFSFSVIAMIFLSIVHFGVLFLVPIYLQTLRNATPLQSGMIQGIQALATLATLPVAGRLSQRIAPRTIGVAGLALLAGVTGSLMFLDITTPFWVVVAILTMLGVAIALNGQIPVAAMQRIDKDQRDAIADGSTIITQLRATAAPLGVAGLSGLVQAQMLSQRARLANAGWSGSLLDSESMMLAMRGTFTVACVLAIVALVAMWLVPSLKTYAAPQTESTPAADAPLS